MLNDVASVELERIVFSACSFRCGIARKNDGGIERTSAAGGTVGDKVNVRELIGVLVEDRGSGLFAGEDSSLLRRKMLFDALHFRGSVGQFRIRIVGTIIRSFGSW